LGASSAPRWRFRLIAAAAGAFLAALPADLQRAATFAVSDKERQNWHYVPRGREGVPLKQMPRTARAAAHELMKTSLSAVGYGKAVNIFRLEDVLRRIETFGLGRDPDNYAFTVFGTPGPGAPWGWRLEGHHLSLNFTLVPGKPVAVTPAFFGANPAEVRSGPLQGLRTLAREEDLARTLAEHTGQIKPVSEGPPMARAAENRRIGDLCKECGQATFVYEEGCKKCLSCGFNEC